MSAYTGELWLDVPVTLVLIYFVVSWVSPTAATKFIDVLFGRTRLDDKGREDD